MSCCRPELCCRDHSLCGGSGLSSASPLRVYDQNRQGPRTSDGPSAMAPVITRDPRIPERLTLGPSKPETNPVWSHASIPSSPLSSKVEAWNFCICLPLPKKRPIASAPEIKVASCCCCTLVRTHRTAPDFPASRGIHLFELGRHGCISPVAFSACYCRHVSGGPLGLDLCDLISQKHYMNSCH